MNVSAVNGFVKSLIVFLLTGNSLKPIHLSAFAVKTLNARCLDGMRVQKFYSLLFEF